MLHTITKRLEICVDINIDISEVDRYTWIGYLLIEYLDLL